MDATMTSASASQQPSLSDLLQQSRKLTNHLSRSDLPAIQLGLDQIENQSRKLVGRAAVNAGGVYPGGEEARAHYLLANGGINAAGLADAIHTTNIAHAFEPLRPIHDTDVEGYLKHEHEQVILSAIEEGRRETIRDFYRNVDRTLHRNWEKQKRKIMEEFGSFQPGASISASAFGASRGAAVAPGETSVSGATSFVTGVIAGASNGGGSRSLQMHSKMMRYDIVVKKLNEARLSGTPFPLAHAYLEAVQGMSSAEPGVASKSVALEQCWRTVTHMVCERDVQGGEFTRTAIRERQYAGAYLDPEKYFGSIDGMNLRRRLICGAKSYLEEQFAAHMEDAIARNPVKAQLGGIPSVQSTVAAYCRVHLQSKEGQWSPDLETIVTSKGKVPIWAHIYFLLRIGQEIEAVQAAVQYEPMLRKLDHSFLGNFKSWIDSPDRILPKMLRDRFFAEYNLRFRGISPDSVDPYKLALYKLIGRIDPRKRFPVSLVRNSENWLWLQLSLVREHLSSASDAIDDTGINGRDSYTLQDVAATVLNFGEAHFDPKGNRPYHYFQILILVGQLERSIAFLYSRPACQSDAVQFAITAAYYGLLRVPSNAKASHMDYLTMDEQETHEPIAYLDFAKLIQRYVRPFVEFDAREALQYLYLVCLSADAPAPVGQEQVAKCHDLIRSLVLESRQYFELLGDVRKDGTKTAGLIEQSARLIKFADSQAYLNSIVRTAAAASEAQHRTRDAILLYNLAEEYDTVISVLNKELGNKLMDPSSARIADSYAPLDSQRTSLRPNASFAAAEDITSMAHEILASYEKQNRIVRKVSTKNRDTCKMLLELKRCIAAYSAGDLEHALQAIETLELIPLRGDVVTITRKAEEFKDIDPAIAANLSDILLVTMNIISKLHTGLRSSMFGDSSKQRTMTDLRHKARALLTYAGQLRLRMSNETYSQLLNLAPQ
ncbi:NIC-domain-containing protein [Tilletiaria anomala UBC 951]|uniref:Nuclear pore protein n=1 Tax=Tilletiaria anomala (strain ATCC 24038 / CBS 436.72 / UBC 951) TaxID=1037660 RepID=A0A066W9H4_TILAU|nr:NIC-domain-containing protein [Tilletiaria anomala UBC 951]KDN50351.1 NIC-domain-containing protein [Tilletiaria anomala UBC 951]